MTLAVAIASYRFVEQPIRHGAFSRVQLRKFTPAIAVALAVALFVTTNGASTPPGASSATGKLWLRQAQLLRFLSKPDTTRVLLVGNSVAYYLGPGFQSIKSTPQPVFLDAAVTACTFPPQIVGQLVTMADGQRVTREPCDPAWEAGVAQALHPQLVFWIDDDPPNGGGTYKGRSIRPCTAEYDALYRRDLTHEVAVLGASGAKVVITTSAYSRPSGFAAVDCQNAMKREVARSAGALLVDLGAYICPNRVCRTKQDGVTLRPDGFHYSGAGGEIVAKWLLDQAESR